MKLGEIIEAWFPKWEYVGTLEGHVAHTDGGAPLTAYWIMRQKGNRRRYRCIDELNGKQSRHSIWAEAQVRIWADGGPVPGGIGVKAEPEFRPKAQLIVFPGGKS